jgi:type III secretion system YscI/HrpB-like protein
MGLEALNGGQAALLHQTGLAGSGAAAGASGLPPAPGLATGAQLRFEEAMRIAGGPVAPAQTPPLAAIRGAETAQATPVLTGVDAVPLAGPQAPAAPPPTTTAQAGDRAVRGLELPPQVGPGQSILDGLGRLRTVFDQQVSGVAAAGQRQVLDTATLMNLQADVVRYTLLVDVTSKLAGKSTMALDTLMKGQ